MRPDSREIVALECGGHCFRVGDRKIVLFAPHRPDPKAMLQRERLRVDHDRQERVGPSPTERLQDASLRDVRPLLGVGC